MESVPVPREKTSTRPLHKTPRRELSAPSQCNVEWVRAGPGATGMCVYFATGDVSPERHDPPSTNFAKRGRRARRTLKECTFISLGTDPEVQDNIEHKSEARVDHRLDSPAAARQVPTEAQGACSRADGVTQGSAAWAGGAGGEAMTLRGCARSNIEHTSEARGGHRPDSPAAARGGAHRGASCSLESRRRNTRIDCVDRKRWRGSNGIVGVRSKRTNLRRRRRRRPSTRPQTLCKW